MKLISCSTLFANKSSLFHQNAKKSLEWKKAKEPFGHLSLLHPQLSHMISFLSIQTKLPVVLQKKCLSSIKKLQAHQNIQPIN